MTRQKNFILREIEVYVKRFIVWYKESAHPLLNNPFLRMKALNFRPNYTCSNFQLELGMRWVAKFFFFRFDSVKYVEIKTKTKQKDLLAKDKNKQEETSLSITSL